MSSEIVRALLVFVGAAVVDFLWAGYVTSAAKHRPTPASLYSAAIVGVNGAITLVWINEPRLLVAFAFGAFAGTYVKLRWFS